MSTMDGSFKKGASYDLPEAYVKPWLAQGIVKLDEPAAESDPVVEATPEPEPVAEPKQPKRRGRKPKVVEPTEETVAEDESPL